MWTNTARETPVAPSLTGWPTPSPGEGPVHGTAGVLVFKLDRSFRSVKHLHDTLAAWELVGISFQSQRERFDTSTALGRLLLNLLACLAELELIRERVKAGMDRARRQGKKIGRPSIRDRKDLYIERDGGCRVVGRLRVTKNSSQFPGFLWVCLVALTI